MINRKILIMIYISLVIFITIMFIILSILGSKSRYGYFGNFVMNEGNIDETLRMNEMYDIKTNFQKTLTNDKGEIKIITDNKSIIKFILTNENMTSYCYGIKIGYYSKIFKHSDIYGVYINKDLVTNSHTFIKDIKVHGGSPFGNIISTKKIDLDKIENIKYTLKLKYKFYFTILFIITYIFILLYICSYAVLSLNIKHLKLFIPLIIIFSLIIFLSNLKLNYFGIILLIIMIVIFYNKEISCEIFLNKKLKLFILISTSLFFGILYVFISIHTPYSVGHDFSLIIPRAYSLLLYAKNNGIFSTEFASPLFGAGLISYANPQYDQFSILYFLDILYRFGMLIYCVHSYLQF